MSWSYGFACLGVGMAAVGRRGELGGGLGRSAEDHRSPFLRDPSLPTECRSVTHGPAPNKPAEKANEDASPAHLVPEPTTMEWFEA
jgi:hypothetical protein